MKYKVELTLNEIRILRDLILYDLIMDIKLRDRQWKLYKKLNVFLKELEK